MAVTVREIKPNEPRRKRRIGMISGEGAESAFVALLRVSGWLLVLVSVIGSFYGLQGKQASEPATMISDLVTGYGWLLAALGAQAVLSIGQWGSRARAKHDRRFWLVYLALLALSASLNWLAYGPHLVAWGIPWFLAAAAVVGGDAIAELVIVYETKG